MPKVRRHGMDRQQLDTAAGMPALQGNRVGPVSWLTVNKFDRRGAALADGHYSRRTPGSPQFMPPGETLVFVSADRDSVFGWWRPHANNPTGHRARNGLDGWTCSIFRRTSGRPASELIVEAEDALIDSGRTCGPDGLLTYVFDAKVASENPGYCFKEAAWHTAGKDHQCCSKFPRRSADGRKTLLHKPFEVALLFAIARTARPQENAA